MEGKSTILLDFDVPVHRYSKGWADGTIYDPPTVGAFDAIRALSRHYKVVIFTTRATNNGAVDLIARWFELYGLEPEILDKLEITNVKQPALFQIDDRAIRFNNWTQAMLEIVEHYGELPGD
jgi:hypothetical protein